MGLHYLGVYHGIFARAIACDLANAGVREGIMIWMLQPMG